MNLDDNILKKIRAYLDHTMHSNEQINFEKELIENQDLADIVNVLKKMDTVYSDTDWDLYNGDVANLKDTSTLFKGEAITAFSKQVRIAESNYNTSNKNKFKNFIKYTSSIAAAALIIFSGYYYFLNQEASTIDLYNDYYNRNDLPSFTTKSDTNNNLSKAENLFKTKHYEEALKLFTLIENKQQDIFNPNLNLYIAICHLELNNYDLAQKKLDILLQSNTLDFHKAYWFKSLTYLKQDKRDEAIMMLELIVKEKTFFKHEKAKALLKKLD